MKVHTHTHLHTCVYVCECVHVCAHAFVDARALSLSLSLFYFTHCFYGLFCNICKLQNHSLSFFVLIIEHYECLMAFDAQSSCCHIIMRIFCMPDFMMLQTLIPFYDEVFRKVFSQGCIYLFNESFQA